MSFGLRVRPIIPWVVSIFSLVSWDHRAEVFLKFVPAPTPDYIPYVFLFLFFVLCLVGETTQRDDDDDDAQTSYSRCLAYHATRLITHHVGQEKNHHFNQHVRHIFWRRLKDFGMPPVWLRRVCCVCVFMCSVERIGQCYQY